MIDRRRLIPAVILGAMGLLALKVISWTGVGDQFNFVPLADQVAPVTAKVNPDGTYNPAEFKGVTQMWAKAREPYIVNAADVTGSVPAKPKKDSPPPDPKAAAPGPKEGPVQAMPPESSIKDRSAVMNEGQRPLSPAERALVERIGERRDEMNARQRELDMREKLLETVERKLENRVGELKAVEDKIDSKKDDGENAESQGLKKLIIMYENMKPKDAARVFDRLPSDVLVPVVLQMNPRKMSEVLASMSPEAAEKLTVALATRARARTQPAAAATGPAPVGTTELPAIAPAPAAPAARAN
jgi:flagellar motility protein MotE (MotC chaperone)